MKIQVLETIRQGMIGGGETHLLSLVEHIDKSVFEPSVLSFTEGPMVEKARSLGIKTRVIPTERPFDFRVWKSVGQLIEEWNIDLVHAHGTRAASNVLWPAKWNHLPIIYTVHGWSFHNDQKPIVKKIRILSEKYITSRTNANISVSLSNQQTGNFYLKNFESFVIPNGVDQSKFCPERLCTDIRLELGIPKDSFLVLFAARFTNHKQPLKLIGGFSRALKEVPSLRLLMVGEGDAKQEAEDLVDKLNIRDKVYFLPFRSDIPDLLAASDIFALPSLWEGMSISLLEAMSMGKVVVASNVDGNSEVVKHMENGWLVDLENIEENLAGAFVKLSRDPQLRASLQTKAMDTINDRYNTAIMTRKTEEIYCKLIDHKTQPKIRQYVYGI
jgi:glycosyltransferase involved in cell wall biosynthesis